MFPTLFKIYWDATVKGWIHNLKNMGLTVEDDTIHSLYFADGHVVMNEDEEDLCYMIRKVKKSVIIPVFQRILIQKMIAIA